MYTRKVHTPTVLFSGAVNFSNCGLAISQTGSREVKMILGDFNEKVGKGRIDYVLGGYGLESREKKC